MTRLDFLKKKNEKKKISMVTCYDFWSAQLMNQTDVDCLLVGDSLAMIMHGHDSTIPADVELMALHTRAVRKGAPDKFIVSDMPFLANRKGLEPAMDAVFSLMSAGASAIKIEGVQGHEDIIKHIVDSGVPVMGHLGLTPQSVHQLGGFKVQGQTALAEDIMIGEARKLQEAGAFAIVLECIPTKLAKTITNLLDIPTIGIGAGIETDGQVLVLQDLLGMNQGFKPKFLRHFAQGAEMMINSVNEFHSAVTNKTFPVEEESYE